MTLSEIGDWAITIGVLFLCILLALGIIWPVAAAMAAHFADRRQDEAFKKDKDK